MYYLETPTSVALTESELIYLNYAICQLGAEGGKRFEKATGLPAPDVEYLLDGVIGSVLARAQETRLGVLDEDED